MRPDELREVLSDVAQYAGQPGPPGLPVAVSSYAAAVLSSLTTLIDLDAAVLAAVARAAPPGTVEDVLAVAAVLRLSAPPCAACGGGPSSHPNSRCEEYAP